MCIRKQMNRKCFECKAGLFILQFTSSNGGDEGDEKTLYFKWHKGRNFVRNDRHNFPVHTIPLINIWGTFLYAQSKIQTSVIILSLSSRCLIEMVFFYHNSLCFFNRGCIFFGREKNQDFVNFQLDKANFHEEYTCPAFFVIWCIVGQCRISESSSESPDLRPDFRKLPSCAGYLGWARSGVEFRCHWKFGTALVYSNPATLLR